MATKIPTSDGSKFPKQHKLTGKKSIDDLFQGGSTIKLYPLLIKFLPITKDSQGQHKFLVSVPKRKFKRAVDRNKLKRRIREAYRLHRNSTHSINELHNSLHIAYIYIGNKIHSYDLIESKLIESLKRLGTNQKGN